MVSAKCWRRRRLIDAMRCIAFSRLLIASLFGLSLQSAFADAGQDVQQRLDALGSLHASFVQQTFDERGHALETLEGEFAWARPGQLRWEVKQPYTQLIVSDGVRLWLYEPDLQQASLRSLSEVMEEGGFLSVLAGMQPLREGYQVDLVQASTETTAYRLRPLQDNASMRDLVLRFDAEGLSALEFVDGIGQQHQLRFSARAAEISANAFVFVPPTGTEVIRSPAMGVDG